MEQGQSDTVVIALAFMSMVVSIVTAILAYLAQRSSKENTTKIAELDVRVDGRLTQLLASTASASHAEGMVAGMAAGPSTHLDTPHEVVVTNSEPVPVVVKAPKKK